MGILRTTPPTMLPICSSCISGKEIGRTERREEAMEIKDHSRPPSWIAKCILCVSTPFSPFAVLIFMGTSAVKLFGTFEMGVDTFATGLTLMTALHTTLAGRSALLWQAVAEVSGVKAAVAEEAAVAVAVAVPAVAPTCPKLPFSARFALPLLLLHPSPGPSECPLSLGTFPPLGIFSSPGASKPLK